MEGLNLTVHVRFGAEHDHGDVPRRLVVAQASNDLEAVDVGHDQVDDDDGGHGFANALQGGDRVQVVHQDDIRITGKHLPNRRAHDGLIIHQRDIDTT